MPGITFMRRRWNIGSDDLFYPGLFELVCRSVWFFPQLVYYVEYHVHVPCDDIQLLNIYYIGFLALSTLVLFVQLLIVLVSSKGTITYTRPRRHMGKLLYVRLALILLELIWGVLGIVWIAKIKYDSCSKFIYFSVLANIVFGFVALGFLIVSLVIVFDPISHIHESDVAAKQTVLYYHLKKILCCCYCCLYTGNSREPSYENSYRQISSLLETLFRGGDLTPSDVAAGIILLSNKETDQYNREYIAQLSRVPSTLQVELIPKWMSINEASYYIRYAVATYSWPYYLYMHNMRGFCDICCTCYSSNSFTWTECCCCCCCRDKSKNSPHADLSDSSLVIDNTINTTQDSDQQNIIVVNRSQPSRTKVGPMPIINGDNSCKRHLKAFKFLAKVDECDLIYANFQNELFHSPFCILVDHFKKTIVITIRGTLSMRDVITDMTADCGMFDIDHLRDQPCHIGILNTADNIYNRIRNDNLLEKAFKINPVKF